MQKSNSYGNKDRYGIPKGKDTKIKLHKSLGCSSWHNHLLLINSLRLSLFYHQIGVKSIRSFSTDLRISSRTKTTISVIMQSFLGSSEPIQTDSPR